MGRWIAVVALAAAAAGAVAWFMRGAQAPQPPPLLPAIAPAEAPDAPPPTESPANTEAPLLDQWFGRYVGDQKVGWVRVEAHRDADGRIALREEHLSRSRSQIARMTRESTMTVEARLDDADLSVLDMHIVEKEQERSTVVDVVWEDCGYTVTTVLDGGKQSRRLLGTGGVCGSNDLLLMRLAAQGKLTPGSETRFQEFDLATPRAIEKTVKTLQAAPGESYEVEFDVVRATLDAHGVVSRAIVGGEELRAESPAVAKRMSRETATMRDDLSIDFAFPRFDALDEVVLEAKVRGDKDGDLFQASEYQRVEFRREGSEGIYLITMLPYRRTEAEARDASGDLAEFLEATPMVQSDDPGIIAKAKGIVAGIEDPTERVRALAAWIHTNLRKHYTEVGGLSATETLRAMGGDCSEHATLFNAFARAIGIPVRECSGYVFLSKDGGRHAWSQVWIEGRWMHVDTVVNCVGADPRYILMWEHLPGQPRDLTLGRRQTVLETNAPRMRVQSFVAWGMTWTPDAARESVRVKEGIFDNPLLGLSARLPEGWSARDMAELSTVTLERGGFELDLRPMPYASDALRKLLGSNGTGWKELSLGSRKAHRRGRVTKTSVNAEWAVPFGRSQTFYVQLEGGGPEARMALAEAERILGEMTVREAGE